MGDGMMAVAWTRFWLLFVRLMCDCVVNWLLVFDWNEKLIVWFEKCLLGFGDFCRLWVNCSCKIVVGY
ncbi:hypothetical protein MtrunA17_Chr7g0232581 [Medicago truncatula]|uniref:Transmembrane protein n=1 Tax=Medicago truncatula TaxID=3880 RepID=A0A396H1H3_MEDTR|nr:hypothetical protein MtrunA17_Chr7g0232581 [Medicago truncatula]